MEDAERIFLEGLRETKKQNEGLPDFMVYSDQPDKIRLAFCDMIEPPISREEYTIITISPQVLLKMSQMLPQISSDMAKKQP